jgi:hypothetical protein
VGDAPHADSRSPDLCLGDVRLRAAGQRSRRVAKEGARLAVEQGCLLAQARAARTARKGGPRIHKRGALHDAWRQTPVDVARDGTAIMIHGNEKSSELRRQAGLSLLHSHGGSSCAAKGKVQVDRQVKLLPAPQLLPESMGLDTPKWVG